ncbi:MAG: flagellar motor switch protein FliN [Acidobacteria bacterium]|nr:flagellar motor switch protein FliN [Acidobacteriota bacterium]
MKDKIQWVGVEKWEKVLKTLAVAYESGLARTFTDVIERKSFTSCVRVEKTTLQTILKSATKAISVLEVQYTDGLTGNVLLLVRSNDLFRLGGMISGTEGRIDDTMSPEMVETCVQFFARALAEANRSFSDQHGAVIASRAPRLINPEEETGVLQTLEQVYDGALSATFEFIVEPKMDSRIHVLVQPDLLQSLRKLVPDYDPEPPVVSEAEKRRAMHRAEEQADSVSYVPAAGEPSSNQTGAPRAGRGRSGANWNVDLLLDVELPIAVTFGEAEMLLRDVLKLGVGSVIELDKSVNDPVVITVNQKPIARGEVVMVDGNYGVRILEVESTAERLRSLG